MRSWYNEFPAWDEMNEKQKSDFIARSIEEGHKRHYYDALEMYKVSGPKWEELTEDQRQNIRDENRRFQREMNDIGNMIKIAFS